MAEFEINCPHCGEELTVQSDWVGKEGRCPSCKKTFTIAWKHRKFPRPAKKSSGNCNMSEDDDSEDDGSGWSEWIYPILVVLFFSTLFIFVECHAKKASQAQVSRNTSSGKTPVASADNSSFGSKNIAAPVTVEKAKVENSQVKISVSVKTLNGTDPFASYKFAAEYKLYADGECVATRTTNRISWYFQNITVKRGAKITAEVYERNGFGATVNVRNGPGTDDAYATKDEGYIEIVCM